MALQRIIGRYTGTEKGPLLICFGGMHGNEPAGILALEAIFKILATEPDRNKNFKFKGRILGLRGNLRAMQAKKRFILKDLNRQWTIENVTRIKATPERLLEAEDLEIKELLAVIEAEVDGYEPEKLVFLDFHTTTAYGGIFSIPTEDPESLRIAIELHAPVIKGMLKGIRGTSLHYFSKENFIPNTVAVCFESGQHLEPLSVSRAIAALTNCMRTIGCVTAEDVENKHDSILIEYSKDLPKVAELITIHSIKSKDQFQMTPNYKNFQAVKKGTILANDQHGPIRAQEDGLVLMPLYQQQGDDGFFLVKEVLGF
ncbi:MAG: succinylglutamate desuccinylase/aspartoacylase family protein [Saprospiraceae bacterium]